MTVNTAFSSTYLQNRQAILLDMNSTFMLGEDRFDDTQDYSQVYRWLVLCRENTSEADLRICKHYVSAAAF